MPPSDGDDPLSLALAALEYLLYAKGTGFPYPAPKLPPRAPAALGQRPPLDFGGPPAWAPPRPLGQGGAAAPPIPPAQAAPHYAPGQGAMHPAPLPGQAGPPGQGTAALGAAGQGEAFPAARAAQARGPAAQTIPPPGSPAPTGAGPGAAAQNAPPQGTAAQADGDHHMALPGGQAPPPKRAPGRKKLSFDPSKLMVDLALAPAKPARPKPPAAPKAAAGPRPALGLDGDPAPGPPPLPQGGPFQGPFPRAGASTAEWPKEEGPGDAPPEEAAPAAGEAKGPEAREGEAKGAQGGGAEGAPPRAAGPKARPGGEAAPPALWIKTSRSLRELQEGVGSCRLCPLGEGGKPRFFGKGPEGAPFLLALGVSEAGAAAKGDFLGREERELLDSIIVKALKLPVGGVYVMPVLRCPKPDDALPRGAEKACGNISLKEIKLARPKAVLSFGHEAARILSKETAVLDTLRRKKDRSLESGDSLAPFMMTIGLDVMLEFPELKKDAWADIKTILRVIARK